MNQQYIKKSYFLNKKKFFVGVFLTYFVCLFGFYSYTAYTSMRTLQSQGISRIYSLIIRHPLIPSLTFQLTPGPLITMTLTNPVLFSKKKKTHKKHQMLGFIPLLGSNFLSQSFFLHKANQLRSSNLFS